MEDEIADSFVDLGAYDRHARSRSMPARRVLGACTLLGTGMALGLLVGSRRAAVPVLPRT
jgi:hypothetical protein